MLDLSTHGVRFTGGEVPSIGTPVRVQMQVPCRRVCASGVVVRDDRENAAVEFRDLDRRTQLALNSCVLEAAPPPMRLGVVLIVIDDPIMQMAIGSALDHLGYQIISRSNPLDVVQHLVDSSTPLHAAIVSAHLPNRGGEDIVSFLATELPGVRLGWFVDLARPRPSGNDNIEFVIDGPESVAAVNYA